MVIEKGMNYSLSTDHSFQPPQDLPVLRNAASVPENDQNRIFRMLSVMFPHTQVLQLCNLIKSSSQEVFSEGVEYHRRLVTSSTASERLSLLKDCLSQFFTTSWAEGIMTQAQSNEDHRVGRNSAGTGLNPPGSALPLPTSRLTSASKPICVACDQSFSKPQALRKHQERLCERTRDWVCQSCPNQVFDEQIKLEQHHCSFHADTCPHRHNEQTRFHSDACKKVLSQSFRELPKKRVWGCPCCISWFDTPSAWNQHAALHRINNCKVENWHYTTMFRSLLQHRDLVAFYNKYGMGRRSWANLAPAECEVLKSALERHVLPSHALGHSVYSHLTLPECLVLYAYLLGTATDTSALPPTVAIAYTVTDAARSYCSEPSDQLAVLHHFPLNLQTQGHLETCATFQPEQQGSYVPSVSPYLEAPVYEELETEDSFPMQYRLTSGNFVTWQVSGRQFQLTPGQAPGTDNTYILDSRRLPGTARTRKNAVQRRRRQKPTEEDRQANSDS